MSRLLPALVCYPFYLRAKRRFLATRMLDDGQQQQHSLRILPILSLASVASKYRFFLLLCSAIDSFGCNLNPISFIVGIFIVTMTASGNRNSVLLHS